MESGTQVFLLIDDSKNKTIYCSENKPLSFFKEGIKKFDKNMILTNKNFKEVLIKQFVHLNSDCEVSSKISEIFKNETLNNEGFKVLKELKDKAKEEKKLHYVESNRIVTLVNSVLKTDALSKEIVDNVNKKFKYPQKIEKNGKGKINKNSKTRRTPFFPRKSKKKVDKEDVLILEEKKEVKNSKELEDILKEKRKLIEISDSKNVEEAGLKIIDKNATINLEKNIPTMKRNRKNKKEVINLEAENSNKYDKHVDVLKSIIKDSPLKKRKKQNKEESNSKNKKIVQIKEKAIEGGKNNIVNLNESNSSPMSPNSKAKHEMHTNIINKALDNFNFPLPKQSEVLKTKRSRENSIDILNIEHQVRNQDSPFKFNVECNAENANRMRLMNIRGEQQVMRNLKDNISEFYKLNPNITYNPMGYGIFNDMPMFQYDNQMNFRSPGNFLPLLQNNSIPYSPIPSMHLFNMNTLGSNNMQNTHNSQYSNKK